MTTQRSITPWNCPRSHTGDCSGTHTSTLTMMRRGGGRSPEHTLFSLAGAEVGPSELATLIGCNPNWYLAWVEECPATEGRPAPKTVGRLAIDLGAL